MSPLELKELLAEIKAELPVINRTKGVVNDSMLGNCLENHSRDDNQLLIGVLPSYGSIGKDTDNVRQTAICQLMILEKTAYGDLTDDQFWSIFERTYQTAKKVKEILIRKAGEDCLPHFVNIDVNGLDINPIWGLAECNGYSIDFDIT